MMHINLIPFIAAWVALACFVVGLAFYRKWFSTHEDDVLHIDQSSILKQSTVAHRLDTIDRWGKTLTVIGMVYGLALAAGYFYQVWIQGREQIWK